MIELLIVLVIMGILLGVAGPRVAKSLGGLHLKTTARKVAGVLRYTRSRAVSTGRQYNVVFDLEKRQLISLPLLVQPEESFFAPDNASQRETDLEEVETDEPDEEVRARLGEIKTYRLPGDIGLGSLQIAGTQVEDTSEGIFQLAFFPNGTSQGAAFTLADAKEREWKVTVDFLTGAIRQEEVRDDD